MANSNRLCGSLPLFYFILLNTVNCSKVAYEDSYVDVVLRSVPHSRYAPEDALLNVYNISRKYGYELESYRVVTEDGYILGLYRLLNRRVKRNGEVVLLMHGWMSSSDDWITPGPGNSPAFLLADLGYDVWMGNVRGNKHSLKHVRMSFKDLEFWDFHLDDISLIDVRSMVDYVLKRTKKEKIYYIGGSQGTIVINILLSRMHKYNHKIKLVVELAPIAWLTHLKSPLLLSVLALNPHIYAFTKQSRMGQVYLTIGMVGLAIFKMFCHKNSPFLQLCYIALELADGPDPQNFDPDHFYTYATHSLAGSSAKQINHFCQIHLSHEFKSYDYGAKGNFKKYGTNTPPLYNLQNFTAPVMLVYGMNDQIAHPTDVKRLYKALPNVVDMYQVPRPTFNHIGFFTGKTMNDLVIKRVLKVMKKYA